MFILNFFRYSETKAVSKSGLKVDHPIYSLVIIISTSLVAVFDFYRSALSLTFWKNKSCHISEDDQFC